MGDSITLSDEDALIVVDVQNDFLPGGSLAITGGDDVVPPLNRYITLFAGRGLPVVATRDWHPETHCSFQTQGGPWPAHCVAGSNGADFSAALELPDKAKIISKATRVDRDAYSGFEDTDLHDWLGRRKVRRLFIGGLATDYCVLNTVRDGMKAGYEVVVLLDAIRPVDVHPGDGNKALAQMDKFGAAAIGYDAIVEDGSIQASA